MAFVWLMDSGATVHRVGADSDILTSVSIVSWPVLVPYRFLAISYYSFLFLHAHVLSSSLPDHSSR
jgi:hypothetical protein